jgi:xylulokinase
VIGALMADDKTKNWSAEICGLIGWDMTTLPPVVRPETVVGGVTAEAAAATGLAAGTKVVCSSNDTTVEFFGVGAVTPGIGAVKLATAGVLFLATDGPSVNPPISCYPHIVEGMYYTATGTNSCASAHRWLRDNMFAAGGFEEMDRLAGTVPAGADGLIFHPYLQGERAPYWDPLLRADFIGMTISHNRAHFARALYARRAGAGPGVRRHPADRRRGAQRHLAADYRGCHGPFRGADGGRRCLVRRRADRRNRHRDF